MYEQNVLYLVKHLDLGAKNLNKICLKIVQKVLKWPLQYVNFQEFSGRACPRTPLEPFLFSSCFKIIVAEKKLRTKKCQKLVHLPKKISECTADMKTFFKRPFTSFSGLTSLYLVNIQPNSKFHPSTPPKFSGSAPDCGIEFFLELPSLKHAGSAPVVVL